MSDTELPYIEEIATYTKADYDKLLYASQWQPTEEEQWLESIAEDYFRHCHFYDLGVCTSKSPRTGEPIPTTPDERRAITRNAQREFDELVMKYRISKDELRQAIRHYAKHRLGTESWREHE